MEIEHYKNPLKLDLAKELERNKDRFNNRRRFDHQEKAHKKMTEFFNEKGKRGIIVLPTGAGKTYTAVYWLLKNAISKNIKVLWIADQGFLLEQAFETFRNNILEVSNIKRNEIQMRIVSGSDRHANGNSISTNDDVLFITAQTAISYWDSIDKDDNGEPIISKFHKFLEYSNQNDSLFIVYDEAHHTPAFGRRNLLVGGSDGKIGILEKYPSFNLLGLTATPTYTDVKKRGWLWKIFTGGIIEEAEKDKLQAAKILAFPDFLPEKTDFNFNISDSEYEKLVINHQELPERIIKEIAENDERNEYIANFYNNKKDIFGKTIIFVDSWIQCRTIENKINDRANKIIAASIFSYVDSNKSSAYINSRTSDQNEINLEKFRKGEIQVLLNVKMLTEGIDVPDVKSVFITRETNSKILATQMIGRALRGRETGGNKDRANIVFFIDNWSRHVLFAGSTLIGDTKDEKIKERGYRPIELIRIDLIDQLNSEFEKQSYEISYIDMVAAGWYSISYNDVFIEQVEGKEEKSMETFKENVLIYEDEKSAFDQFIQNFYSKHINSTWEKEELDKVSADELVNQYIAQYFNHNSNRIESLKIRLIQISRHLGQQYEKNEVPNIEYFSFEQREELNFWNYVSYVKEKDLRESQKKEYLESVYFDPNKTLLKVTHPSFQEFRRAFYYEMEVFENRDKLPTEISKSDQKIVAKRLASDEVKKIVFSRDENKCCCCGKTSNLHPDHISAHKHEEYYDDHPDQYQTLCGTCNQEKNANGFNYRITNFKSEKYSVEDVKQASNNEDPIYYFTRLINCYYKTNAVQKNSVRLKDQGNSIWHLNLKYGAEPQNNILKVKDQLIEILKKHHYKLKDIEIVEDI